MGRDRPPGWCESHHVMPWSRGGPTTVDDGVLLCSRHHREVHDQGWQLRLDRVENVVGFRRREGHAWQRHHRYRALPRERRRNSERVVAPVG
ncbi:HNH endonuclease signature motif containing protein [Aeromicrobium senzhongii]|nr:HNH endonuclease signature motif containing protein [Aeromicrobium senzhongii]